MKIEDEKWIRTNGKCLSKKSYESEAMRETIYRLQFSMSTYGLPPARFDFANIPAALSGEGSKSSRIVRQLRTAELLSITPNANSPLVGGDCFHSWQRCSAR